MTKHYLHAHSPFTHTSSDLQSTWLVILMLHESSFQLKFNFKSTKSWVKAFKFTNMIEIATKMTATEKTFSMLVSYGWNNVLSFYAESWEKTENAIVLEQFWQQQLQWCHDHIAKKSEQNWWKLSYCHWNIFFSGMKGNQNCKSMNTPPNSMHVMHKW